jgi:D-Tyr-tRNAtyr deacylase
MRRQNMHDIEGKGTPMLTIAQALLSPLAKKGLRPVYLQETSPASAANMASYLKLPAKEWEKAYPGYAAWRAPSKGRKTKSK